MALIECPECGHQVSDAAETCPWCGVRLTDQTAELQLQLELSQIELEWERERAKLLVSAGPLRGMVVPRKRDGVLGGLLVAALGVGMGFLFFFTLPPDGAKIAASVVPGFFLLVGLGSYLWAYAKAEAYEEAHAAYLKKKEAARSKYEGQAESET